MEMANSGVLSGNTAIPVMGFGCYKIFGNELVCAIDAAIEAGYRYIDTASFYKNEKEVGHALKNSSIPREKLFIVSKIWPTEFANPYAALERSLENLGLEYLDAFLLHWPGLDEKLRLKAFEFLLEAQQSGKIIIPGVSNFLKCHLENLHRHFQLWPTLNQIEVHPFFQQENLCSFCKEKGIQIISWSPLGRGKEMRSPVIESISTQLNKSASQILLRWQIQKAYVPIPKSAHPERIKQNSEIFDFLLNDEDIAAIDALEKPGISGRIGSDPMLFPL